MNQSVKPKKLKKVVLTKIQYNQTQQKFLSDLMRLFPESHSRVTTKGIFIRGITSQQAQSVIMQQDDSINAFNIQLESVHWK